jgi:hypothetical protein
MSPIGVLLWFDRVFAVVVLGDEQDAVVYGLGSGLFALGERAVWVAEEFVIEIGLCAVAVRSEPYQ